MVWHIVIFWMNVVDFLVGDLSLFVYIQFLTILCFQIKHMMAFIEQEANEKAEEIDAKVDMHS